MKKILLFIFLLISIGKAYSQGYCIKITKISEQPSPTGTIELKFELTAARIPVSTQFYSISLSAIAGINTSLLMPGDLDFANGNFSLKPLPYTMGTRTLSKDGTPNIVFDFNFPPEVGDASGKDILVNDVNCNQLELLAALLPLEWLSFKTSPIITPTGTKVALDWSTASEKDVKNFEVERSEDGKVFKKIGDALSASNTVGKHNYSALDEKPLSGISYYRIRQTDYDGKTSLTKIQSVNLSNQKSKSKFTFYPNPIHKGTPLSILTDVQGDYSFKVIDLTGRIVYSVKLQGSSELKNMTLSGGTYLYQILSGDQQVTGKIFVAE